MLAVAAGIGCGDIADESDAPPSEFGQVEQAATEGGVEEWTSSDDMLDEETVLDRESPADLRFGVRFSVAEGLILDKASLKTGKLPLLVGNNDTVARTFELALRVAGVLGNTQTVKVATVTVPAGATQTVQLPLKKLPILSLLPGTSFSALATMVGQDGARQTLPTEDLLFHVNPSWTTVSVYDRETLLARQTEWLGAVSTAPGALIARMTEPLTGLTLPLNLPGNTFFDMFAEGKAIHTVGGLLSEFCSTGEMRTLGGDMPGWGGWENGDLCSGLWDFGHLGDAIELPFLEAGNAKAGTAIPQTYCTTWSAFFVDAGKGEDILAGNGTQSAPASFAYAEVTDKDGVKLFSGTLDKDGCTPELTVKALETYTFSQVTTLQGPEFGINIRQPKKAQRVDNPPCANVE